MLIPDVLLGFRGRLKYKYLKEIKNTSITVTWKLERL